MTHKHNFEVLWDEENERLFAFCASGGIAECNLELEDDEISCRLNAVEELPAEIAELWAYQLGRFVDAQPIAKFLRKYSKILEGE